MDCNTLSPGGGNNENNNNAIIIKLYRTNEFQNTEAITKLVSYVYVINKWHVLNLVIVRHC